MTEPKEQPKWIRLDVATYFNGIDCVVIEDYWGGRYVGGAVHVDWNRWDAGCYRFQRGHNPYIAYSGELTINLMLNLEGKN